MGLVLSDIRWGEDEARGDDRLPQYFVDSIGFDGVLEGKTRYIIGRKGTGKTAICEMVRRKAGENPCLFFADLSLRNFPIQDLRAFREKSYANKSQFVPIWTFLLLVELSRLVLQDQSVSDDSALRELSEFLEANFPADSVGFAGTLSRLRSQKSKVAVKAGGLQVGHDRSSQVVLGGEFHYQKVTNLLTEFLGGISSGSTFYILMDDLDEGFQASDSSFRLLLLALFRAAEDILLKFRSTGLKVFPIVALRSDIFATLNDNDLNKLDDATLRLKWSPKVRAADGLRELVSKRIAASTGPTAVADRCYELFDRADSSTLSAGDLRGSDRLWWYLVQRTLERPRDVLKYLKYCAQVNPDGVVDRETLIGKTGAEKLYSQWFFRELGNELYAHLPVWKQALTCLTSLGKPILDYTEFERELSTHPKIRRWLDAEGHDPQEICEVLFDSCAIGNLRKTGRWLFRFQDEDLEWNSAQKVVIHPGLYRKLRIPYPERIKA